MKYGVVIPARNEKGYIEKALRSIFDQDLGPEAVVVVDDSSEDGTGEIAREMGAKVIRYERRSKEKLTGTGHIPMLLNMGLKGLRSCDYIMISGADCLYPRHYVSRLIEMMRENDEVVASGVAEGERARDVRGAGRMIEAGWFKSLGFKFPERPGFESWLIFRALKEGRNVGVHPELRFKLLRPTEVNPRKARLWGVGMRMLNYWWPYALGRCLLFMLRSPPLGLSMLRGYLSDVDEKYEDLGDFVPRYQRRLLWRRLREILGGL